MAVYVLQIDGAVVAVTDTLTAAMGMAACYYGENNIMHVTDTLWVGNKARITHMPVSSVGVSPSEKARV